MHIQPITHSMQYAEYTTHLENLKSKRNIMQRSQRPHYTFENVWYCCVQAKKTLCVAGDYKL